jgi:uncharacterized protein (DUF433 family)
MLISRTSASPFLSIAIETISTVRMVANGLSTAEILDLHPDLEAEDVREALLCAAENLQDREQRRASNE